MSAILLNKGATPYILPFSPASKCIVIVKGGYINVEYETTGGKKGPYPLSLDKNKEAGVGITNVTKVTVTKKADSDTNSFTLTHS